MFRERAQSVTLWEKRGTIRQGSKGTRVPLRDQFNRIPEAYASTNHHHPLIHPVA